jgi:mRNA interferase RelE/StbE
MSYRVSILPPADKSLRHLDPKVSARVRVAIDQLQANPRPRGCKKLVGQDAWRIRVGDWRVVYLIRDRELLVIVVRVAHRREIYE